MLHASPRCVRLRPSGPIARAPRTADAERSARGLRLDWPGETGSLRGFWLDSRESRAAALVGACLPGPASAGSSRPRCSPPRRAGRGTAGRGRAPRSRRRARRRASPRAPRGSRGRSTSSTSIRRSRRRRRTSTRRGSTARPTGASSARRPTTTAGRATASAAYLDMLAPRLEALAGLLAPTGHDLGARRLARVVPRAGAARRDPGARRVRQRDRLASRARTSGARRRAASSAARSTRSSSTDATAARKLVPPTRLEPIEPAAVRWDDRGAPVHHGAARRLHRRVDRAPRGRGARAPHGERAGVREVLPREERGRDALPRAPRRRALDRRAAASPRARRGADGLPDAEAARAARSHHRVRVAGRAGSSSTSSAAAGRRARARTRSGGASSSATRRRSRIGTARARLLRAGGVVRRSRRCGPPARRRRGADPAAAGDASSARGRARPRRAASRRASRSRGRSTSSHDPARPFRTAWHSERAPGRPRPRRPRARRCVDRAAPGPLAVRVWYDDGGVGHDRRGGPVILRDPVHGLVAFEGDEEGIVERLLDTPGGAAPAARAPARGDVARVPGRRALALRARDRRGVRDEAAPRAPPRDPRRAPRGQRVTPERAREALAAAFLHDVGHGPLSHLFEDAIPGAPPHETWTERIVLDPSTGVHRVLASIDAALPARVVDLVHGRHELPYLAKAVSGELDVDRCDYLLRDAHATGVRYGLYDLDWLLRSLRFAPTAAQRSAPALAIDGAKGLPRHRGVHHRAPLHVPAGVPAQGDARGRVDDPHHPGARGHGAARGRRARRACRRPSRRWRAASRSRSATTSSSTTACSGARCTRGRARATAPLADLARRIRARSLFKTLELFGEQAAAGGARARARRSRATWRARAGYDPDVYVGLDVATDEPLGAAGAPLMVVYAKGPARPLHEVSFLLGRLAGQVLSRVRLVLAPELRDRVTHALGL